MYQPTSFYLGPGAQFKEWMKPRHWADTKTWKVWPKNPNEIAKYGKFSLKWTIDPQPQPGYINVCSLYSTDSGKTWNPVVQIMYSYGRKKYYGSTAEGRLEKEMDDAILEEKYKILKEASKEKRRLQYTKQKKEAASLGISVKELTKRNKQERLERNPFKVTKKDVKNTQTVIAIAPVLKDLKVELDGLMKKIDEGKRVKITHTRIASKRIKTVIDILTKWQK